MELRLNWVWIPLPDMDPNIPIHTDQYICAANICVQVFGNIPFCPYAAQYGNWIGGGGWVAWRMFAVEKRVIHSGFHWSMHWTLLHYITLYIAVHLYIEHSLIITRVWVNEEGMFVLHQNSGIGKSIPSALEVWWTSAHCCTMQIARH